MEQVFVFLLVGFTSLGAYQVGVRTLGLAPGPLAAALRRLCELAGVTLLFFITNLSIGLLGIFAVRGLTSTFLSVYLLDDLFLLLLSALQGIIFACWWMDAPGDGARPPGTGRGRS